MRLNISLRLILAFALLISPCRADMLTTGAGGQKGAAVAYTGPGDVNGSAVAWCGTRAFSASYATGLGNALDLVDQAGANPITIKVTAAGDLDNSAIATWVAAHSVTTIKVTKCYDQGGGTNNFTQATLANMPSLVNSISGLTSSRYCMQFASGSSQSLASPSITQVQPLSLSSVSERTSGTGFEGILTASSNAFGLLHNNAANQIAFFDGGSANPAGTANDSIFHAAQVALPSGTPATLYIDGSSGVGASNAGTSISSTMIIGWATSSFFLNGFVCEAGLWSGNKSANNSTMNSNQHTYWGF